MKKTIQKALTILLACTLALEPVPMASVGSTSVVYAASEEDSGGGTSTDEKAEAEAKKKAEEAAAKKAEEEAAAKKAEEEAAAKKAEEEAAAKKAEEEAAAKKAEEEAAAKKAEEEVAAKKAEEEAAAKKAEEEAAAKKAEEEAAAKKAEESEKAVEKKAETESSPSDRDASDSSEKDSGEKAVEPEAVDKKDASDANEAPVDSTEEKKSDDKAAEQNQTEDKADEMPAKTFRGSANGVTVTVKAKKGTFPKGTEMRVKSISSDSVIDAIEKAAGAPMEKVKAVDITFYYEGKEIQPKKSVDVTLKASGMDGSKNHKAFHISGGHADVVDNMSGTTANFDARSFSPYAIGEFKAQTSTEDEDSDEDPAQAQEAAEADQAVEESNTEETTADEQDLEDVAQADEENSQEADQADQDAAADETDSAEDNKEDAAADENADAENADVANADAENADATDENKDAVDAADQDAENVENEAKAEVTADNETTEALDTDELTDATGEETAEGTDSESQDGEEPASSLPYTVGFYYTDESGTSNLVETRVFDTEGQTLGELPEGPSREDAAFIRWEYNGSEVSESTVVTNNMKINAAYKEYVKVVFKADGTDYASFDVLPGEEIGMLPEAPFKEGAVFVKWVDASDDSKEITEKTVVPEEGLVVNALFSDITVYKVTVEYFYKINGNEITFDQDVYEIIEKDVPYTITVPESTKVKEEHDAAQPTYYPSQPTLQVTSDDLANADETGKITKRVEYVSHTAEYDYVYLLKDLDGNGYSEIEREHVYGVLGATVTPTVKEFEYASLESVDTKTIEAAEGTKLEVKYSRKNYTLHYESNGGSYVSPQTVPYETTVTVTSDVPTRQGYEFDGWFTDSELTQRAAASFELKEDTTLYAKWKGAQVKYTIVYMQEKYDNNTGTTYWAYFNSRVGTGEVGTEIFATSAPDLENNINGYEKDTERNAESSVVIEADGSSVLTVYYKLIRYTLVFNINRNSGRITIGGETYTGSNYKIENVVLGQDVSSMWPASSNEIYATDRYFDGWTGASAPYITKRYELVWDNVENANANHVMTFQASWSTFSSDRDAKYWLQQPDGTYKVGDAYTQVGLNTSNLGAKEIDGYSKHNGDATRPDNTYPQSGDAISSVTQNNNGSYVQDDNRIGGNYRTYYEFEGHLYRTRRFSGDNSLTRYNVTFKYTYNFYYDRNRYDIDYFYGSEKLTTKQNIFFEADISGSEYNYTPVKPAGKEDYTWGGWYADSALQRKYTFDKMPGNNLVLYAKWIAPQFTVTFDTQGGSGSFDPLTVDKGKKITYPGTPSMDFHHFDGWYDAAKGGDLYDWNMPITENITLYAHWSPNTIEYVVHYYVEGTEEKVFPDKKVKNPALQPEDKITEKANSLVGYRPDASSKDLTLNLDNKQNVIVFYYSQKAGSVDYTVNYVLKDHPEVKVHESKTLSADGSQVTVVEKAASVDESYLETQTQDPSILEKTYYPTKAVDELLLTSNPEQNVITFEYVDYATATVTVNYYNMAGTELVASETMHPKAGSHWTVPHKDLQNYHYHHTEDAETGQHMNSYTIHAGDVLTVNVFYQKKLTIRAKNKTKTYNGQPLVSEGINDVEQTGLDAGHSLQSVGFTGSQTVVGSSATTPRNAVISGAPSNYYFVTYVSGNLTVTALEVTINVDADRWNDGPVYDGTARTIGFRKREGGLTISNPIYESLYGDAIWNMIKTVSRTETNAGHYTIPEATIREKIQLPADSNFNVTLEVREGELTIPPRPVEISTQSAQKEYDGEPLTEETVTIGGNGFVDGEGISVKAIGSQTEVGESDNTFEISWGSGEADNYAITYTLGKLEVTKHTSQVTLKAASDSRTYNGAPLTNSSVTAEGLPAGFAVEAVADGSQTDVGEGTNAVQDDYKILDAEGVDKTEFFTNIKKENGTLNVTPAPVTITTASAEKEYDGTALKNDEAEITGLVNDESATVTATGEQTEVGDSNNTYSIDWGNTNKDNYSITEKLGILKVKSSSKEVKLIAATGSKTYDGTPLTNSNVTADGLPEGFTVEATASGSQTDAGESANKVNDGYVIKDASGENKTANFTNVTRVDGTLTVNKAPLTVRTGSDSKPYDGIPLTKKEASVEGLVGGESVEIEATGTITEVGNTPNTYKITWGDVKSQNYHITENLGTLTITENSAEVILTAASDSKTYDGEALTNATVTATGLPEGFTVEATTTGSRTDAGETANVVNDGYVIKDASGNNKTSNFTHVTKVDGTLTVNQKELIVTTGSGSKQYDGTPLTNSEASLEGLIEGETATVKATGTITEVGRTSNTHSITWDGTAKSTNYRITENLGTLIITENAEEVTLTAATASKTYDGTALSNNTVTASGLPAGFTVTATASGSQTDAGSSANTVNDGYVIKDATGIDKTVNFTNVKKVDGTLTVNKAPVTITTGGDTKVYDGIALTNAEAEIEGLVNNETATVTATGSQTEVGESDNTYDIKWETAKKDNYVITEKLGTLKVTKNISEVKLTAATATKPYDGTALSNNTVTASGLPAGFTVTATASGSQTDAGSSKNVVDDGYVIKDANGTDKTANFTNVKKVDGTLTVNPKAVTITTGNASKAYDGTALTKDEASIEGLVDGESVTLKTTGTITEIGSTDNTYSIEWDKAKEKNYTVTEKLGTLTITENTAEVTLTAATDSKTYDGKALTNAEVTAAGLPAGFTVTAAASGSQTDAGSSANVVNDGYVIKDADGKDKTANFTNVKKVDGTLTVNPKAVTITTGSASKAYDGTALTKDEASIEGLVEGESVTLKATGTITEIGSADNTYSIEWDKAKEDNYTVTDNLGTLTITKSDAQVVLTAASDSKTYDGKALTNSTVTAAGLPDGFTFEATASGSQTDAGESANVVNDGYVIRDKEGKDKTQNFTKVEKVDGKLTVNPKAVTITTGSASKAYDGTALTKNESSIEGLVNGESVTLKATGTITEVGETTNTYSITWDTAKKENYTITENLGTLTITENGEQVTLTAASDSKTYDGKALTNAKVTATGLPAGFTVTATASGSQTDAGSSANTVNDGYVIKDASGIDKTANFTNVKKVDGTLTVNPKAVTITTGSASKAYDGTPLTQAEATIEGLAEGESVTLAATGTITEVGSTTNTYSITWDKAKKENYTVTNQLGTLEITRSGAQITLTAASDSKTYDGKALTNTKVTATGLPAGFTVTATASGSQTDAGESANVVNDGYVIKDANGTDKTANFTNVKKVDGTLTVNPKAVTITTGSASKAYDGTPLTKKEAAIEGLIEDESVSLKATGTITEVGSTPNTYSIEWDKAKEENYTVTENLGTLTITENTAEVTLTAATDSKTYDGKALTNAEVTAAGLPEGFTVTAAASGSQTDAGESANVVNDGYVIKDADGIDKTANFTNVKKVDGTLTVNPKAVTITTGSASKAYDGTPLTKDEASIEGLVKGESVTLAATGKITEIGSTDNTYSIKWDKAKEGNYTVTENLGTLTITKSDAQVVLTAASDSKTYDGKALTNSTVTAAGLPDGFTFEATASGSQTDAGESANVVNDGYVFRDAEGKDKTENFTNVEKVDGKLTVNPAQVTIKTGTGNKEYDGTALTNDEASIEGLVEGENVTLKATGTITEVGSTPNTYSIEWDKAKEENYTVTENLGTLTISKNTAKVNLTAASDSKTYDGSALSNKKVTASGLPSGFTVTATASGSQTDAGSSANIVDDGYVIKDAEGVDKTANFTNVEKVDGTLTVNPKAATVTTGSASKAYDGTALTNKKANIEGLIEGESVSLEATGTITEVGSTPNTYSIKWDKAKEGNYTITDNLGTLTITSNSSEIMLTAATDSKVYDGTPLTNSNVKADGLPSGFTVEATASGSQTDAGSSANVVNSGYVIKNADGEDRTENFTNVKTTYGTLTVTQAELTVSTDGDTKEYDGTALTNDKVTVTGLVKGEKAEFTTTGSQTEVGTSKNTYTVEWGEINPGNYTIKDELGDLVVTANTTEIILTAASASKTYDGKALTDTTVTVTGKLPEGHKAQATTVGSQTDVGSSENQVADGYKILDADKKDVTAFFSNVTKGDPGTLTVNPAPVTITTEGDEKEYDGTPLVNDKVEIEGLAEGESVTLKATGSQTEVGGSDNTYSIVWDKAKEENYTVTDNLGTLTVTPRMITVKAKDGSKVYDSKALKAKGYEITAGSIAEGETEEVTVSGEQTLVGSSKATVDEVVIKKGDNDVTKNYEIKKEDGTLTVTDGTGPDDEETVDDDLVVTKTVDDKEFKLGETVSFKVTVTNIYSEAKDIKLSEIDGVTLETSEFKGVEPGATVETTATYVITEEDILAGEFKNTVTAEVGNVTKKAEATAKTEDKNGHLTVEKVTTSETPEEGYALGDTIEYKITVKNDGNLTITEITVTDELTGDEWTLESLAPGESKDYAASYTVTEADVLAGEVVNVATAEGTSPDPEKPEVPTDPGKDPEPTVDKKGHLTVEKVTTSKTPENGYAVGDKVEYKITVKNDGNLTITEITVKDDLTGDEWKLESLAPGESKDYTAEYTVTEADSEAGKVENVATATGTSPDPDKPAVPSEEGKVIVPVGPVPATYDITFKLNGGVYNGSTEDIVEHYPVGTVISIHEAPTREGYVFDYWKGSEYQPGDKYTVTGDHVFVAQWKEAEKEKTPEKKDHSKHSKSTKSSGGSSPRTGDDSHGAIWLLMMLLAAAGTLGTTVYRKKNRR